MFLSIQGEGNVSIFEGERKSSAIRSEKLGNVKNRRKINRKFTAGQARN